MAKNKTNMLHSGRGIGTFLALTFTVSVSFAQTKKVAVKSPAPSCIISDFRHAVLSVHQPVTRTEQAKLWLAQNLPGCTLEKVILINNNRSSWLGNSDSSFFMNLLDSAIESKATGRPDVLARMYGSFGIEGAARAQTSVETQATPAEPAQPAQPDPASSAKPAQPDPAPEKRAP